MTLNEFDDAIDDATWAVMACFEHLNLPDFMDRMRRIDLAVSSIMEDVITE